MDERDYTWKISAVLYGRRVTLAGKITDARRAMELWQALLGAGFNATLSTVHWAVDGDDGWLQRRVSELNAPSVWKTTFTTTFNDGMPDA